MLSRPSNISDKEWIEQLEKRLSEYDSKATMSKFHRALLFRVDKLADELLNPETEVNLGEKDFDQFIKLWKESSQLAEGVQKIEAVIGPPKEVKKKKAGFMEAHANGTS